MQPAQARPPMPGFRPGPGQRSDMSRPTAPAEPKFVPPATGELITIKPPIIVRDLAEQLKKKPFQLIADLMELNVFANVNQAIDEVGRAEGFAPSTDSALKLKSASAAAAWCMRRSKRSSWMWTTSRKN